MSIVHVALDDLALLRDTWNDDITPARLRADSGLLRKLLVEGVLGRAWRESGRRGEPRILAPDLKSYLGNFERRNIVLAQAGGATYRGTTLVLNMIVKGEVAPGGHYPHDKDPRRAMPLSRFVDGPTLVAQGVTIKRRELIQYIANKIGGLHYDESRRETDFAFKALDELPRQVVWHAAGGFDLRYYELLAIGHLLVTASEIQDWMTSHGR